jgi:hypothetical protein
MEVLAALQIESAIESVIILMGGGGCDQETPLCNHLGVRVAAMCDKAKHGKSAAGVAGSSWLALDEVGAS